jgi:hypothetical protein
MSTPETHEDHPAQIRLIDAVLHARITTAVGSVLRDVDPHMIRTGNPGEGPYETQSVLFEEPPFWRSVKRERGMETPVSRMDYYQDPRGPRLWVYAHSRWDSVFFHDSLTGKTLEEAVDELERFAQRVAAGRAER